MTFSKSQFRAIRRRLRNTTPNAYELFSYDKVTRTVTTNAPVDFDINALFEKENRNRMSDHQTLLLTLADQELVLW